MSLKSDMILVIGNVLLANKKPHFKFISVPCYRTIFRLKKQCMYTILMIRFNNSEDEGYKSGRRGWSKTLDAAKFGRLPSLEMFRNRMPRQVM